VSESVLNAFQSYSWPGNVREMRNTLERAIIVCDGAVSKPNTCRQDSASSLRSSAEDSDTVRLGVGTTVEEAEKLLS